MTRLVQLRHLSGERRVAVVADKQLRLLEAVDSIYALAQRALDSATSLAALVSQVAGQSIVSYDEIYEGQSEWRLLPAIDHPEEPTRCQVTGTGLTHLKSAESRQEMHATGATLTDSMRMYEWGVEGGRPAPGTIGVSPEWFYKGCGTVLRAHGEPLIIPPHAHDGGEEAEIVGIYIVDAAGYPRRIGMAIGNEFSDHVFEEKNYLYLAASKLMTCATGPELIVDPDFRSVPGEVSIERDGSVVWHSAIHSGESVMNHTLANMEHHHFKHPAHRRPGDIHVHFFGADAFSFSYGVKLQEGDVMQVRFEGFGRPLRNPVRVEAALEKLYAAQAL
jgi:hypothetical protein